MMEKPLAVPTSPTTRRKSQKGSRRRRSTNGRQLRRPLSWWRMPGSVLSCGERSGSASGRNSSALSKMTVCWWVKQVCLLKRFWATVPAEHTLFVCVLFVLVMQHGKKTQRQSKQTLEYSGNSLLSFHILTLRTLEFTMETFLTYLCLLIQDFLTIRWRIPYPWLCPFIFLYTKQREVKLVSTISLSSAFFKQLGFVLAWSINWKQIIIQCNLAHDNYLHTEIFSWVQIRIQPS